MSVSRLKSEPIYVQIAEDLRKRIASGEWHVGEKIPGELEFTNYYNTSRGTVRKSLDLLVHKGLVRREPGRGTFVIEQIIIGEPRSFSSLSNELLSMNYKHSSSVLEQEIVEADIFLANRLGLQIGDPLVKIKRLRRGNDLVICIQTAWLPFKLFPGLESIDLTNKSLYQCLQEKYQLTLGEADEVFSVTAINHDESILLEVTPGTCAFRQDRVTHTQNGIAFEYVVGIFRGDRYKVQLRFNIMTSNNVLQNNQSL